MPKITSKGPPETISLRLTPKDFLQMSESERLIWIEQMRGKRHLYTTKASQANAEPKTPKLAPKAKQAYNEENEL